ncbi:branched-chain amino acid aminotransferase/4-amino-4-deoxychorismate lyase [Rhexocercosporidium sp. MPI-PUGE-AT-0058]|nr:branched-chain amino acid aminotransferase/4-amino-4-deoxychorismate lyase [Rhexocercosporidium sp. MPI-PUGE-AT-0058]
MSDIPPPLSSLDWSSPALILTRVAGHIESRYDRVSGQWSVPKFVTDPVLKIHGLSSGLHYGQQCYEGLKAHRTPENKIAVFRPYRHAARFVRSCETVFLPLVPEEHFVTCVLLAVRANAAFVPPHDSSAALYIRPMAYGSGESLGLGAPPEAVFCVFVKPVFAYHGVQPLDALVVDEFDRAAPRGTGATKVGGNYAPVIRWSEAAKAQGFGLTLHLDSQTRNEIDEFSTSAFLAIKEDRESGFITLVVPDSPSIIDSVTSSSCMVLARSLGWHVEKRPVKYAELADFSEVMAAGTAASLVSVRSITRKSTEQVFTYLAPSEGVGKNCQILSQLLDSTMHGRAAKSFGWLVQIDGVSELVLKVEEKPHIADRKSGYPLALISPLRHSCG